jgi:transcriptional regulator with XRE-family HTH domain
MARHRLGKLTQQEMADLVGTSRESLRKWAKEGIDITDEAAVRARAAQVDKRVASSEDMAEVKLRKLRAEADLKEHELEVERGRFVSQESQRADGQKLGLVLQGMMLKMAGDLTPVLAGRPAGEVKKAIDKYAREKLVELSQYAPDTLP